MYILHGVKLTGENSSSPTSPLLIQESSYLLPLLLRIGDSLSTVSHFQRSGAVNKNTKVDVHFVENRSHKTVEYAASGDLSVLMGIYARIGDIAHVGIHPPNVAAGYDLVWRNCIDDYVNQVSIWHPRAPDGFVSPGCVAVAAYMEPEPDLVYCVAESLVEQAQFEELEVWSERDSYPWACHMYQVQSDAWHFVLSDKARRNLSGSPQGSVMTPLVACKYNPHSLNLDRTHDTISIVPEEPSK